MQWGDGTNLELQLGEGTRTPSPGTHIHPKNRRQGPTFSPFSPARP